MKRITALVIVLLLLVLSVGCGRVENAPLEAETEPIKSYLDIPGITQEEISAIEKLKAERGSFYYGYLLELGAVLMPDGTYMGFSAECVVLLSELFGMPFVAKPYESWQRLRTEVESGMTDFTDDLTSSVRQEGPYIATDPIADRMQRIYTLADSEEIKADKDINGLRLGFLENSVNLEPILRHYPGLTFEAVTVPFIANVEDMLVSGEIDAFVTERNLDAFFDENVRIRSQEFFPLAFTPVTISTANPEVAPVISVLNKYMESGGGDKLFKMYKEAEYEYTKHRLRNSFTAEEIAYLDDLSARGSSVNVALEHDNYPISFYNTEDKEFQGIAEDVLAEVSGLTGIKFENIVTEKTPWADILERLRTGEASVVSQLGYSDARREYFIWSNPPYSLNNYALISKLDYPVVESYQITRLRVGTVAKSIYEDLYNEWFPDNDNLVGYETQNNAFDALERGEIDLVMGAEYMLLTQTNYREKTGYMINYRFNTAMESMFGFNKDEAVLKSIFDKAQGYIAMGSIENYWNSRVFDYSKKIFEIQRTYLSVFSFAVVLALIAVSALLARNTGLRNTLVERTTMLSTIYESIPDTLFCKNTEGVYTSCNPSFEKQAGMPEAELIGKTYNEVFKDRVSETVEIYKNIDGKVISGKSMETVEETVIYPDGSKRLLETLKAPLIHNGKTIGLLGIGRDVTQRREIETRLERVINIAQIAFLMTVDGIVIEANEYSRKHIGVKIGDDIRQFYTEPGKRDAFIEMAGLHGVASNVVVRYNIAGGESHRFLASFTTVDYDQRTAYILWAIDIEQEEMKNAQLRVSQESLHAVLDILPTPIRIVDVESYKIVYVNDSFVDLLGYESAEELCGLNVEDILPEVMSDGTNASERVDVLMRESAVPVSVEMEYNTKNRSIVEALVVTRQIDYKGRRSSIGVIKDLSAEKERARILLNAVEREKEANQSKSLFLANMSHEIRTPMNGIIGMTDLLMGERLSGRELQYVKDIKTSAESLLGIINDILDLSKISEGRLQITPVDVDLSMMLKNIVSMMAFSARSKSLEFIDDIRISTPEYVRLDDVRLKQVIVNLLSNAVKFTKAGFVKLFVKIEDGNIAFEVSDSGMGIKENDQPLIFMAFEQADKQKNRAIKGTGLGLSISKNLVELMGGKIWLESEYGTGSTFYVTVPYVAGDETAVEVSDAEFEYIYAPTAQILLVDDIQTNLTVGAGLLRMCGITADVAISGYEAIELISLKDYDIVFMDHMMPEMDGIEAMNHIRAISEKYASLPVIALTANAVNESRDLLLASGMNDFLSKPIDKSALVGILQKWLPAEKIESGEKHPSREAVPYSQILAAAAEIEGLDIGLALARISGMQDVLEQSLKQIASSMALKLKIMDERLAGGDLRDFSIEAHGLKGALANIGATHNSELAAELEIAAKAENTPLCVKKFAVFADVIGSFAEKLKSIFPETADEEKPRGDSAFLAEKIKEAIGRLNNFEAEDALKCLNELSGFTFGKETDDALGEAINMAKAFKYKKAAALLGEIEC